MTGSSKTQKKEYELINHCFELFQAYHSELESHGTLPIEDFRLAIYALELTIDESCLTHPGAGPLFEVVKQYLFELRLLIEEASSGKQGISVLAWKLFDLNELLRVTSARVLDLPSLPALPQGQMRDPSKDYLQAPRLIIGRLRQAKGLSAA